MPQLLLMTYAASLAELTDVDVIAAEFGEELGLSCQTTHPAAPHQPQVV